MQTRPSKTNERLNPSADFAPRSFDCSEFYEITESERSLPVLEIRKKLQCCILYMTARVRNGETRCSASRAAPPYTLGGLLYSRRYVKDFSASTNATIHGVIDESRYQSESPTLHPIDYFSQFTLVITKRIVYLIICRAVFQENGYRRSPTTSLYGRT